VSGETEQQVSGWTVDTLKEHLEARLTALDERISVQARADQTALELAGENIEARLEKLNELRQQVSDDRSTYLNREVGETRLTRLEGWQARLIGALVLVTIILPTITALIVYLLTRTAIPTN
jgi:hypothetical protein